MVDEEAGGRSKARFGPSALVLELNSLVGQVRGDGGESAVSVLDQPIGARFSLTDGQEQELGALEADKSAVYRLQELVKSVARQPEGQAHFVVTMRPDDSARGGLSHDLCLESLAAQSAKETDATAEESIQGTQVSSLRIAHCDADCRNWGWG